MHEASVVLRRARQRAGMTQADVARNAGTAQPVVSAYEHGRRDPSLETLRRLVDATGFALRVEVEMRGSDLPPPANDTEHAARLLDVLSLADAIPRPRSERTLDAPRMTSR